MTAEGGTAPPHYQLGPLHRDTAPDMTEGERAHLARFCDTWQIPREEVQCASIQDGEGKTTGVVSVVPIGWLRRFAERLPLYSGMAPPEFVRTPEGYPAAATVRVLRAEPHRPVSRTAFWHEHAPSGLSGEDLETWAAAPDRMLGEVAEAMALRTAFPSELAGIYTRWDLEQAVRDLELAEAWAPPADGPSG